jgi:hypothetical protein
MKQWNCKQRRAFEGAKYSMREQAMKKRLVPFIIGVAIWFGMADAARQIEMLQSETSDLIAKSSNYLFSDGHKDAPKLKEIKTFEPIIPCETENALADKTEESFSTVSKQTNTNLKQEKIRVGNNSVSNTSEHFVARKDVKKLIALANVIDRKVYSKGDEGNSLVAIETEEKTIQDSGFDTQVSKEPASGNLQFYKEYGEKSSFSFDLKVLKPSVVPTPKVSTACPTIVSSEKLKVKTIVLMPEVLKQFGE